MTVKVVNISVRRSDGEKIGVLDFPRALKAVSRQSSLGKKLAKDERPAPLYFHKDLVGRMCSPGIHPPIANAHFAMYNPGRVLFGKTREVAIGDVIRMPSEHLHYSVYDPRFKRITHVGPHPRELYLWADSGFPLYYYEISEGVIRRYYYEIRQYPVPFIKLFPEKYKELNLVTLSDHDASWADGWPGTVNIVRLGECPTPPDEVCTINV